MRGRFLFIPVLLVVLITFSSCLESSVFISLNRNLSGTAEVVYRISGKSAYVSSDLTAMRYQFIPVDETSVRRITDLNTGLVLKNYEYTAGGKTEIVKYSVDFSSPGDITPLSVTEGGTAVFSIKNPAKGKLELTLKNPFSEGTDEKTKNLLKSLFSDNKLSFSLKVSGFLTSTNIGELTEDPSTAMLNLSFGELIDSDKAIVWKLEYTENTGG